MSGFLFFAALSLLLSGCHRQHAAREEFAQSLGVSAGMQAFDVPAGDFILRAYGRDSGAGDTVMIYLEGDGLAWLSSDRPSSDPTPIRPVALSLAVQDDAAKVVYLARPCQYNRQRRDGSACSAAYWTSARLAPEVVRTTNEAIDDIKRRYGAARIELAGYSGGGGLAVLVAAERNDVTAIRTAAANLDTDLFSRLHGVSPMSQSLNPKEAATRVAHIPQLHVTGGADRIVTPALYESYVAAARDRSCIKTRVLQNATHEEGWTEKWPALSKAPLTCN